MTYSLKHPWFGLLLIFLLGCSPAKKNSTITLWIIGDSTAADYSKNPDYLQKRYPVTGWGQVFQPFVSGDSLLNIKYVLNADSVFVDNRAVGGRSTRTFFQEGRWREVYQSLNPGDFVMMQFGHNDQSIQKTERYVNEEGYKEFLRLFIQQTIDKGATPILITPVARNYPWEEGVLTNVHGNYPKSMKAVAEETQTMLIDLNESSIRFFTKKGQEYVSSNYFMNLPAGKFEAFPEGENDNTHFQPEGAKVVANLVYTALVQMADKTQ